MAKPNTKSKASTAETAASPTSATTTSAPVQYRENPRTNEKIDEWIKRNPDQFKFFNEMPHERAVRKLILNEIDKYERREKAKSYRQQEGGGQDTAPRHEQSRSNGSGMRVR